MEGILYFKATISDKVVYVETTTTLINKLFDYFTDNGYSIEKVEREDYEELIKDGEVVYHARTSEIVNEFIETNNKVKKIRYGG